MTPIGGKHCANVNGIRRTVIVSNVVESFAMLDSPIPIASHEHIRLVRTLCPNSQLGCDLLQKHFNVSYRFARIAQCEWVIFER